MKRSYTNDDYIEAPFICQICGWSGNGEEVHVIDFYGVSDKKEIHCPSCEAILGTIKNKTSDDGMDLRP